MRWPLRPLHSWRALRTLGGQVSCPERVGQGPGEKVSSWTSLPSDLGFGSDLSRQSGHLLHALLPQLNLCSPSCPLQPGFSEVKPVGPGVGGALAPLPRPAPWSQGKLKAAPPWASASPSISPVSLVLTAGFTRSHHDFRQIRTHQVQLFTSDLC